PVRVDDQSPSPPVNHDLMVERAQQNTVLDGRRAAVGLVRGVVHLAGAGGLVAAAGPLAVPVRQQHRVADPRRDRLGVPDIQRQARPAQPHPQLPPPQERRQPPGPETRSTALPITACSSAAQAASRVPSRRRASSSTHSRTRSSSASTLMSPVTTGDIAASHAMAAAASPSSHTPSLAPVSE